MSNSHFMLESEAIKLLENYDIAYPAHRIAKDRKSIDAAIAELGFPLVMKVLSEHIVHKSDFGGVIVNIQSAEQAYQAYSSIIANAAAHGVAGVDTVLLCKQANTGVELIVGGLYDETFGPVLMLGMGGILVELIKDVSFRVCPVSLYEAHKMIRELKAYPLLTGLRGQAKTDIDGLAQLITAVSRLMAENPRIKEIDLNPIRLYEHGYLCLDARMGFLTD